MLMQLQFCRLLVIKVFEGASTCSLFDGLNRGQTTSCCNIRYLRIDSDYIVHANADSYSKFSCHSQYKHLAVGLEILNAEISQVSTIKYTKIKGSMFITVSPLFCILLKIGLITYLEVIVL